MPRFEISIEQELQDHGLENVLGPGRRVLKVGGLFNHHLSNQETANSNKVLRFIAENDQVGSNGQELTEVLAGNSPKTHDILSALKQCSTHGAVNAILEMGTPHQKEYLTKALKRYGNLVANGITHKGDDSTQLKKTADPNDIKTGLWRDVVFASMIDTPEMSALSLARRWTKADVEQEDTKRSVSNLPTIRGYHSYIFPPKEEERWEYRDGERITLAPEQKLGTVGHVFPELAKTYEQVRARIGRKYPDDTDEAVEHEAVRELARIIAKSTEYDSPERSENSPYHSKFTEQIAWAQLGSQVQGQFRGMRRKIMGIDLHNIGRFIGKSGNNPYEKKWRRAEETANVVLQGNVEPAREWLLAKVQDEIERQHRRRGNEAAGEIIVEGATAIAKIKNLTNEEVLSVFSREKDELGRKCVKHMSLAQKAIDLHFIYKANGGIIDWINTAPFGLIQRTHKALSIGVSAGTAFAYATAEQVFPTDTITRELIAACRGLTVKNYERTKALSLHCEETGLSLSPEHKLLLGKVSTRDNVGDVIDLMQQGYSVDSIIEHKWLCHLDTSKPIDFPARGNYSQKQRWCAENGYAYLNGGWSKTSVGKIILTRLESDIEESIHDASQWLEAFQIPEEGYDIPALKARLQNGEAIDFADVEKTTLYNTDLEVGLLAGILQAPQELRNRLLLPRKTQKIQQLFFAPEHQLLYLALLDTYRDPNTGVDMVRERALDRMDAFYDEWLVNARGKETTHRIAKDDLRARLLAALSHVDASALPEGENITGVIQRLSRYGDSRKRYIDDATSWLTRHITSPNTRLTKVWGDRAAALIAGVDDSARDIELWQANNALRLRLNELTRQNKMPHNLTAIEVMQDFRNWTDELSRCYSSDMVIRTISEYKSTRTTDALLPAQVLEVQTPAGVYKAEVLAKDDPRGTTIGVDTGCCMTLDGASASCIKSGYRDKNAGFFALYTPEGRLAAQSYFYVNTDKPNILVLDNIEANKGRDTDRIVGLYESALLQYLSDRFASDSNWKIDTVQVGTGYGDAVKSSVLRLDAAKAVPNNLEKGIYTDAQQQRLLLRIPEEQVAKLRKDIPPTQKHIDNTPNHLPNIMTKSLTPEDSAIIRELEKQIYPKHMRQYKDREMLREELNMNGMESFSFLVANQADSSKDYIGYCMAYFDQSETDPDRSEPVIYAADIAILPEMQGANIGAVIFDELLKRTSERGVDKIEMHARETTSYAALKNSEQAKHILYRRGYRLVDHGAVDEFDDGNGAVEKLYLISLEKI